MPDFTPLISTFIPAGVLVTLCTFLVKWIVADARRQVKEVREDRDARITDWKTYAEQWRSIAERMQDTDRQRGAQIEELIEGNRTVRAMLEQVDRDRKERS